MSAPAQMLAEDRIELRSVGVDIGSATTHLLFSRLTMQKVGSRYVTIEREVVYESPVTLTPYAAGLDIDAEALRAFIDGEYTATRVRREEIDTGALILTGVALLRHNARAIAEIFAAEAGRFVAVSAGDNLEAVMAAHGSGAVSASCGAPAPVLNLDMGGGTTKLALCADGRVTHVVAMDAGARLVVTDEDGVVTRLEPAGEAAGKALGIAIAPGVALTPGQLEDIAAYMVDEVVSAIPDGSNAPSTSPLLRGEPLPPGARPSGVVFSGGVSEYVYGREPRRFGDLGPLLADALRRRVEDVGLAILPGASGIRATVVGASQYTAQVSGSTIYLSGDGVVPVRNVPVVAPGIDLGGDVDEVAVARAVTAAVVTFDLLDRPGPLALSLRWKGTASFSRLNALARGIEAGLRQRRDADAPVVVVCDDDVGRLIGKHLVEENGVARPVVSIDCVALSDFDFIDVGAVILGSNVVPVVIKSLMFNEHNGAGGSLRA